MIIKSAFAALLLSSASASAAAVIVLGNYNTGEVVIQGNFPDGSEVDRAVALAKGGSDAGWTQIFGPNDQKRGWGAVLCVRHAKGVFFAEAIGQPSEAEAMEVVNRKADRFLVRLVHGENAAAIELWQTWPDLARKAIEAGVGAKVECAPAWNDQGQKIEYSGKPLTADAEDPASKDEAPEPEAEKPATDTDRPEPVPPEEEASERPQDGPTPPSRDYEAEYREKMQAWEAQMAEQKRRVAEFEEAKRQVELDKADQQARREAAEKAYADQMAAHRMEVQRINEQAQRAKAEYEARLQASTVGGALADWPEAVSVCSLDQQDPQSQFGNWKCVGPLQFDYAKLGAGEKALYNVANSCGGKVESVRDLGMVNGYRIFGCSYGMHPDPARRGSRDIAARFGLTYIPGRLTFRCPTSKTSCRTP